MDAFQAFKNFIIARENRRSAQYNNFLEGVFEYDPDIMESTDKPATKDECEILLSKASDIDPHNLSIIYEIQNTHSNYFLSDEFVLSSLQHFITHFPFHKVLEQDTDKLIRGNVTWPAPYKDFLKQIKNDPELHILDFPEFRKLPVLKEMYKNILQTLLYMGQTEPVVNTLTETCGLASFDLIYLSLSIGKAGFDRINEDILEVHVEKGLDQSWFLSSFPVDIKVFLLNKAIQMGDIRKKQVYGLLHSNEKDEMIIKKIYDYFSEFGYSAYLLYRLISIISKNAFSLPEEKLFPGCNKSEFLSLFIKKTYFLPLFLKYFFAGGKKNYDRLVNYYTSELTSLRMEKKGAFHLFVYTLLTSSSPDCLFTLSDPDRIVTLSSSGGSPVLSSSVHSLQRCVLTLSNSNCMLKRTLTSSGSTDENRDYLSAVSDSDDKKKECIFETLCRKTALSIWEKCALLVKAYKKDKNNIHIIYNILMIWTEQPLKIYSGVILTIIEQLLHKIDFKKPINNPDLFIRDTLSEEELSLFTTFNRSELNEQVIIDCFEEKIDIIDKDSLFEIPGRLCLFTLILKAYERAGEFKALEGLIDEYFCLSPVDYMYYYTITAQSSVRNMKYRSWMKINFDDYYDLLFSEKEEIFKQLYNMEYTDEEKDHFVKYNKNEYLELLEKKFDESDIPAEEVLRSFDKISSALCRDSDRNMDNDKDKFRVIDRGYYETLKNEIDAFNKKYGKTVLGLALSTACYTMLLPGTLEQAYDSVGNLIKSCYYLHYTRGNIGISYSMMQKLYTQLKEMKENRGIFSCLYSGYSFIAFYGNREYLPLKEKIEKKDFYITQPSINKFISKKDTRESGYKDMLTEEGLGLFNKIQMVQELVPVSLAAVSSEKKVYNRSERPVLCFILPGQKNKDFTFSVHSLAKESMILEKSMKTDEWGIAVYNFNFPLDVDAYRVLINSRGETGYSFKVMDFSYSPLYVSIEKEEEKENKLFLHINVELFNVPYNGELKYEYTPDYLSMTGGQNKEEYAEITNGKGMIKLMTDCWSTIRFITPDGSTALVKKPKELPGYSAIINCITYGFNFSDSHGKPFWGLRLGWGTSREFNTYDKYVAFEIEELFENRNIVIKLQKSIKYGKVTVINEQNSVSDRMEFTDKKAGSILTFKGSDLFSIVEIGGLCEEDGIFYERRALVLFMPPELSISAPEKARTGEEVDIVIKSIKKCRVLISIVDARMEKEYCDTKLGEQLAHHLKGFKYDCNRIENYLKTCIDDMDPLSSFFLDYDKRYENIRRCRGIVREDIAQSFYGTDTPDSEETGDRERKDFQDILFFDAVDVDEEKIVKIKLNDRITTWDIHVTAVYENTISSARAQLAVSNDFYVELDLPAFISPGDSVATGIFSKLTGKEHALLHVKTPDNEYSETITESGFKEILLTGPGKIEAELTSGKKKDRIVREILKPGLMTVNTQKLTYLKKGDTIEADHEGGIDIYENEFFFAEKVIQALLQYPFGCSEQTTSKLNGLAHAYHAINRGFTGFNNDEIESLIVHELNKLPRFISRNNLFCFWEGGFPSEYITEKVILNLLPFLNTKYEEAITYIENAKQALLKKEYKSNYLVCLDNAFKKYNEIRCIDDACEFYFTEINPSVKEKCVDYLMNNAHISNGEAFWHGTFYWGGHAEATAKACKVLYDAKKDELFHKGLSFLSTRIKDSRLYSTSDTSALIDLCMYVCERNKPAIAVIDGKECRINGRMNGKKITVQSGRVLVSVKKREEFDVLDVKANNLDFDISMSKINLEIADTLTLSITVKEDIKCPVVSIYLPPVLCSLLHGVRVQSIVAPMISKDISCVLTGIKKGRGKLYVLVYDMYEEVKRGYYSGEVIVQERTQGVSFSNRESGLDDI